MQITKKLVDSDIHVLQPDGRITVGKDCQVLDAAATDLVANGQTKAVLDMTLVSYIDSAALGTIMSCTTKLRRAGGDLRIAGPVKKVMDIFTLTGTHAVLKIQPDVTTACASYSSLNKAGGATATAVPWYIWTCTLAVTSAVIGAVWDISWHKSIGRDSFWTPAHVAIYLCGILAGFTCGYLILATTFRPASSLRAASVRLWGFRAPLGAFVCVWGAIAMIASAPFDDWWHNAYGLDVKVLSPPHVVLILGVLTVRLGALFLVLAGMNRASGILRRHLEWLLLYLGALVITGTMGALQELTARPFMHSAKFYFMVPALAALLLAGLSRSIGGRWICTRFTALYTVLTLLPLWVLPLFPAEPKLGPVYQQVTHFVPHEFPLLLLIPALAWDLLGARKNRAWIAGPVFLLVYIAVQWPFADFLMSPAARNWIFGAHYAPFFLPSDSDYVQHRFTPLEANAAQFWIRMGLAAVAAVVSTRLGLAWGDWMRKIRR